MKGRLGRMTFPLASDDEVRTRQVAMLIDHEKVANSLRV
jgi:hypothetical protein